MKYSLLLAVLLPMTAIAQAPAGDDMPDMGQIFLEQFDTDKDGKVTLAEFRQPRDEKFAMMDGDKDGAVSAGEAQIFSRMMMQRMQQMMQMQRKAQQMQQIPRQ